MSTSTAPTTSPAERRGPGRAELIALLAMGMALAALGIDLMLPAFADIRQAFDLPADATEVSGIVTTYFLGLALGQLAYGPLADRFGRKPTLYVGFAVYLVGALAGAFAPSLPLLLLSRFVWGLGSAGPRVVTLAVVRDSFEGERMSRAMSFIMAVFILVPIAAPTIGAAIVAVTTWRWIFGFCVAALLVMAVWALRLPETLAPEHRLELSPRRILSAGRFVVANRQTRAYTLAMTALYGSFTSYLGSSEIIIGDVFDAAGSFPVIFGGLAAVMGVGMLVNARIVEAVGARRLSHVLLLGYVACSAVFAGVALATGGTPPLWAYLLAMAPLLGCHALVIPNFNTIAMDPMGAVAGTASSVIGSVQIAVGALLGSLLDAAFDGTVRPLAIGFFGYGLLALALVLWAERGRLFRPLRPVEPVEEPQLAEVPQV
ncbi:multidrug effflux MFS transporter [Euzebya sp.]|uniref:multidrug effflux MFS transporter n=1 Tax=Euzebya sp. TaxID=1971409 RepID=UPI003513392C